MYGIQFRKHRLPEKWDWATANGFPTKKEAKATMAKMRENPRAFALEFRIKKVKK